MSQEAVAELPQIVVTINSRGEVCGDTSQFPAELLAQLATPEAKEQMRRQYKDMFGTGRREMRAAKEPRSGQRDFTALKPPGMSGAEFRKERRRTFRKLTKHALKVQKFMRTQEPINDQPHAD